MKYTEYEISYTKQKFAYSTVLLAAAFSIIMLIASMFMPSPLQNVASANEGGQPVMIQAGHADFGPTLMDGKWKLKIRDDTGDEPVWRDPENVVFKLGNNSIIPMPDDAAYSFIGEKPGTKLYVIPQTQNPDIPWLGWNTQEGGVLNELDRGANLSLNGISGPGKLHVYLENGNNNPQQLWDSTKGYPQNSWIEANAHTHVNWVFSKPGVYHVKLTFSGKLKNGKSVSDTRVLNFAVGDNTDPNAALGAGAAAGENQSDEDAQNEDSAEDEEAEENGSNKYHSHKSANRNSKSASKSDDTALVLQLIGIIVSVIAVIIVIFVIFAVVKSKKARQQALEQQAANNNALNNNGLSNLVNEQETTVMNPINNSAQFDSAQWK